jgi:hypothetical protein
MAVANPLKKLAMLFISGPAWTRGEIERPEGTKDMGTWTAAVYTAEQQARLGVDEQGNKIKQESKHLGRAVFRNGFHVDLFDEGTETVDSSLVQKIGLHVTSGGQLGRKAKVEAAKPEDLVYIKEEVSLRNARTGELIGDESISNSADGTLDVWDGEDLVIRRRISSTSAPTQAKDWKLVIRRQTKRGRPGAVEAKVAEDKKTSKEEKWEARVKI